jgi:hypothetical protein
MTKPHHWRNFLEDILERPHGSKTGQYLEIFLFVMIVFSTLAFILETVPSWNPYQAIWISLELYSLIIFSTE